jgi:AcrR family transcriptional regulator
MSLPPEEPGLRERKRLATRRAIELAVLTQARERGIENVTVEDISRVAGVSPRTFFNYFPSKDAALVGDTPTLGPDSDADVEAFVHAGPEGDILAQLAVVLTASLRRAEADREIHQLRREVLNDNAYLFGLRMTTLRDFESRLQGIVARRFTTDHPELASCSRWSPWPPCATPGGAGPTPAGPSRYPSGWPPPSRSCTTSPVRPSKLGCCVTEDLFAGKSAVTPP